MECTYGDRPHRDPELAFLELREVTKAAGAWRQGDRAGIFGGAHPGAGLLPAPDYRRGDAAGLPGVRRQPAGGERLRHLQRHPECSTRRRSRSSEDRHRAALEFKDLTYIRSVEESKALNDRKDPMVIISASGMAETGRILHHLKNNIEDPQNTVMIVSWQAPDTLGRRIAERQARVKIFGEKYKVRAEVVTIGGLSAHAGQRTCWSTRRRGPTVKALPRARGAGAGGCSRN